MKNGGNKVRDFSSLTTWSYTPSFGGVDFGNTFDQVNEESFPFTKQCTKFNSK